MAFVFTQMENGDILVEDATKNLLQTVSPAEMPYEIWYDELTNNLQVVRDLSQVDRNWVRIRTYK